MYIIIHYYCLNIFLSLLNWILLCPTKNNLKKQFLFKIFFIQDILSHSKKHYLFLAIFANNMVNNLILYMFVNYVIVFIPIIIYTVIYISYIYIYIYIYHI